MRACTNILLNNYRKAGNLYMADTSFTAEGACVREERADITSHKYVQSSIEDRVVTSRATKAASRKRHSVSFSSAASSAAAAREVSAVCVCVCGRGGACKQ